LAICCRPGSQHGSARRLCNTHTGFNQLDADTMDETDLDRGMDSLANQVIFDWQRDPSENSIQRRCKHAFSPGFPRRAILKESTLTVDTVYVSSSWI
jgi:hypothetical protein